jgi:hypothetical protein
MLKTFSQPSRRQSAQTENPNGVSHTSPGSDRGGSWGAVLPWVTSPKLFFPLPFRRGEGQGEGSVSSALIDFPFRQPLPRNGPKRELRVPAHDEICASSKLKHSQINRGTAHHGHPLSHNITRLISGTFNLLPRTSCRRLPGSRSRDKSSSASWLMCGWDGTGCQCNCSKASRNSFNRILSCSVRNSSTSLR